MRGANPRPLHFYIRGDQCACIGQTMGYLASNGVGFVARSRQETSNQDTKRHGIWRGSPLDRMGNTGVGVIWMIPNDERPCLE